MFEALSFHAPPHVSVPHVTAPHVGSSSGHITTLIFAGAVILPIIGLLLGEGRLRRITYAVFVAIVITETLSAVAFNALKNFHVITLTESYVNLGVFALTVILLNMGPVTHAKSARRLSLRIIILSVLTMGLLVTSVLANLPTAVANHLTSQSFILATLKSSRLFWVAAAALWLVVLNVWPQDDHKKKK